MAFINFVRTAAFHFSTKSVCIPTKFTELVNEFETRENVLIQGWICRSQTFGKKSFLKLNDGISCHEIQAVVPRNICKSLFVGSAIRMRGNWLPSKGTEQKMEFLAKECLFVGHPTEIPLVGDCDVMRQFPHIRPKSKSFSAVLRLRSHLTHHIHNFFNSASFFCVDMPLITQNDCEGAGQAFSISSNAKKDFFGTDVNQFLQVSTQLHLEAVANAIPRVYTLGPVFRADNGAGRTHISEFRMLEVECAFVDSVEEMCCLMEDFLDFVVKAINGDKRIEDEFLAYCKAKNSNEENEQSKEDGISNETKPNNVSDYLAGFRRPFPRVPFSEAVKIVGRSEQEWTKSLSKREEFQLIDAFKGPLFVTHFPAAQKPFYMRRCDAKGQNFEATESFDLLVPQVGELAGGGVREWEADKLSERLPPNSNLDWYVELRRRGHPRSAGFGLGIDRLMQALFGITNIRDTIAFPRCYGHLRC
ncbi:hypothetical protein niasHT_007309 [Heterodera trifolii]|uniref:Aminoacyl-transfer RNA synthetases class-II family profile domain-containing protein n=1 Tax=Heterodera trifolii TaxID=157864 RepID=A0ABD2LLF7_9BILA